MTVAVQLLENGEIAGCLITTTLLPWEQVGHSRVQFTFRSPMLPRALAIKSVPGLPGADWLGGARIACSPERVAIRIRTRGYCA